MTGLHSAICPVLVGRAAQLRTLVSLLEPGAGGFLLLSGPAGIGKSRLVAEAITATTGRRILRGSCYEHDASLPYAPFLDLLRSAFPTTSAEVFRAAVGPSADVLAEMLPEIADRSAFPRLGDPIQERQRIFAAFVRLVGGGNPAAIIVEDVHWSDETSLNLIITLARRLREAPVALIATYRNDETGALLDHFLATCDRERLTSEIALPPLDRHHALTIVQAVSGPDVPARTKDQIVALAEGNPFYLEELVRSERSIPADRREYRVPRTVTDVVRRRVGGLTSIARSVVEWAALAGRRVETEVLSRVARVEGDPLLVVIGELVASGLLVEETADRLAFRHALTREAVLGQILVGRARSGHRAIAEAKERIFAGSLDHHLAELAEHWYQAGDWEKVLDTARRLGDRAHSLATPSAAVTCFSRAIEASGHLGNRQSAELYRARGLAYERLGDFESARLDHVRARQAARDRDDPLGEWRGLLDLGQLWTGRDYRVAGDHFRQALRLAREIGDKPAIAWSLNRIGNHLMNTGQPFAAIEQHEEALDLFERLGDRSGIAETCDLLAMTTGEAAIVQESLHYAERATRLFRELGDSINLSSSLANRSSYHEHPEVDTLAGGWIGFDDALRSAEEALAIARAIGWRSGEAYAQLAMTAVVTPKGRYRQAFAAARAGYEIAKEIEHRQWLAAAELILGELYSDLLSGRGRPHLDRALEAARGSGSALWTEATVAVMALAAIQQRDLAGARTILATVGADSPTLPIDGAREGIKRRRLWLARGELALAEADYQLALRIAERLGADASLPNLGNRYAPRIERLRGDALTGHRRWEEAESALLSALVETRRRGLSRLQWRVHLSLGRHYLARKKPDRAEQSFASARPIIDQIATELDDAELRSEFLERVTALFPAFPVLSARRASKLAYSGLTERERDVAELIAQGRTNRQIAEALIVGETTVSTHVTNILTKLGFRSRSQIAAWANERGLGKGSDTS